MDAERTAEMLANRLRKNLRKLKPWAKREGLSCYRVFGRDIPEVPLALDSYDGALCAHVYVGKRPVPQSVVDAMLKVAGEVCQVPEDLVFCRRRERRVGGSTPNLGEGRDENLGERVVSERGLRFKINLSDHLDVGLFLDHRDTRRLVGDDSAGKTVANLFCYTSSFSVYAAKGGARRSVSVDLSRKYLQWSADNFRLNGIDPDKHELVCRDAFAWLEEGSERFDIIVLDPPTISRSKRMEGDLDVQRDHPRLIQLCLSRLNDNGVLYFSNNYQGFEFDKGAVRGRRWEEISQQTLPKDFAGKSPHRCFRIWR